MKNLALLTILCMISIASWAQGPGRDQNNRPEPPSVEEVIKKAKKDLNLTESQVAQWTKIHEKYESELSDHSKRHATMQKMGKELEATLTEEQLKKFQQRRQHQRPQRGN